MAEAFTISLEETLLFGVIAVAVVVLAVYGLLITRRAVHSAASIIGVMVCLAVLYTMLEAPFMGVVQVAVYTGAILMMFLFVLMMIGVDSSDATHETIKAQRFFTFVGVIGFLAITLGVVLGATMPKAAGLQESHEVSNPQAIAKIIFGSHALTMELTGALLIVAALGAMTLTHKQRVRGKFTQEEIMEAKMEAYAQTGRHIGQKPPTGVYAESNSASNPALTEGGKVVEHSVPRVLRSRGQANTLAGVSPVTAARAARGELGARVAQSGLPGMPGEAAPDYSSFTSAELEAREAGKLEAGNETQEEAK